MRKTNLILTYLIKLIDSLAYMICLNVSNFNEFLNIRSMSVNKKTPSLENNESETNNYDVILKWCME